MPGFLLQYPPCRLLKIDERITRTTVVWEVVHISIRPLVLAEVVDGVAVHFNQITRRILDYLRNFLHIGKNTNYFLFNYKNNTQNDRRGTT